MIDDLLKKFSKQHKFISQEMLYEMYAVVSQDIENGNRDRGVWAKAFADAKGDEQVAKAAYIELMVERLVLAKQAEEEAAEQYRRELQKSETSGKNPDQGNMVATTAEEISDQVPVKGYWSNPISWVLTAGVVLFWLYALPHFIDEFGGSSAEVGMMTLMVFGGYGVFAVLVDQVIKSVRR